MAKTRKPYPKEFRDKIVSLYVDGTRIIDLTREYGVSKDSIYNWVKAAGVYPDSKATTSELSREELEEENRRLKRKLKEMEVDQEILEKATAWFAQKTNKKSSDS